MDIALYQADSYALQGRERDPYAPEDTSDIYEDNNLLLNGSMSRGNSYWDAKFNANGTTRIGDVSWVKEGPNGADDVCVKYNIIKFDGDNNAMHLCQYRDKMNGFDTMMSGKKYRLTFDAKLVGVDSATFTRIWLRGVNGGGSPLAVADEVTISGSDWTSYSFDLNSRLQGTATDTISRLWFQLG